MPVPIPPSFISGGGRGLHGGPAPGIYGVGSALTIKVDKTALGPAYGALFNVYDILLIRAFVKWGQVAVTYFEVTSVDTSNDDYDQYGATVIWGEGGVTYPAGTPIVNLGPGPNAPTPGGGYIVLDAQTTRGPSMQIKRHGGYPWSSDPVAGGEVLRGQIGHLAGCLGITEHAGEYGIAFGTDVTDSTKAHILASSSAVRLYGVTQSWVDKNGALRGQVDPNAGATGKLFWLGASSIEPTFCVYGDGSLSLSKNVSIGDMGDLLFNYADGVGLWGPYTELIPPTGSSGSWTSSRGDVVPITGDFVTVSGKHPNTRALKFVASSDSYLDFSSHCDMLNDVEKLTIALLIQMGRDWDDTSQTTMILEGEETPTEHFRIVYHPADATLRVSRHGLSWLTGDIGSYPSRHFDADDWLHVVVTLNFSTESQYRLYLNGERIAERTSFVEEPLSVTDWTIGRELDVAPRSDIAIEELAILHDVWTADQVSIAYNADHPLVDGHATEQQGLYFYGDFSLGIFDDSGNLQAHMDNDGFAVALGSSSTYDRAAAFKVEDEDQNDYVKMWAYHLSGQTYALLDVEESGNDVSLSLSARTDADYDASLSMLAEAGSIYAQAKAWCSDADPYHDGAVDLDPALALPYRSTVPTVEHRTDWGVVYIDDTGASPKLMIEWDDGTTDTIVTK